MLFNSETLFLSFQNDGLPGKQNCLHMFNHPFLKTIIIIVYDQ